MTNEFLAEFDAIARDAFADVGSADAAQYVAHAGATPVPCTVMVDRGMQRFGEQSEVSEPLVTVTVFRDQVAQPVLGGWFVVGADQFTIDGFEARSDESRVVCVVTLNG